MMGRLGPGRGRGTYDLCGNDPIRFAVIQDIYLWRPLATPLMEWMVKDIRLCNENTMVYTVHYWKIFMKGPDSRPLHIRQFECLHWDNFS